MQVADWIKSARVEKPQAYKHIVLFPLKVETVPEALEYRTLGDSINAGTLLVTEIDEGGSVPDLTVRNKGQLPVLLLDGEELIGAKQNRVLNTTILMSAPSDLVIPVSCTESGRWGYESPSFSESEWAMSTSIRAKKSQSVTSSLKSRSSYSSDQAEVWDGIEELHAKSGSSRSSRTRAMRDAYEARKKELEEARKVFSLLEGQTGILVVVNGHAIGLDLLSRTTAYERLHEKLLNSYLMDALAAKEDSAVTEESSTHAAELFIQRAAESTDDTYDSLGMGEDHRMKGEQIVGSALVCENQVIHSAFFHLPEPGKERLSGLSTRRRYRM